MPVVTIRAKIVEYANKALRLNVHVQLDTAASTVRKVLLTLTCEKIKINAIKDENDETG